MNMFFKELENGVEIFVGAIFILVGLVGLFLPILPGFLLVAIGLYLIGGKHLIKKIKRYFESFYKK